MHAERNPVFATNRMVFAYAKKDTVALDAISVSLDITAIPTAYHAIAVPSAHPASVAIPQANAHASPISPEELAINAVQDTTNIRSASVCNSRRNSHDICCLHRIFVQYILFPSNILII